MAPPRMWHNPYHENTLTVCVTFGQCFMKHLCISDCFIKDFTFRAADRLHDYDIRVGPQPISAEYNDVPFKLNTRCQYHEKGGHPDEALIFIECKPCPIRGRYVTIQITQNCTDCREPLKNVLQLAEFEVFGIP